MREFTTDSRHFTTDLDGITTDSAFNHQKKRTVHARFLHSVWTMGATYIIVIELLELAELGNLQPKNESMTTNHRETDKKDKYKG